MNKRRKCEYEGCNSLGRNKGLYKGETRYDRFCERHHRMRTNKANQYYNAKQAIPNTSCHVCGWDEAPCDRHRLVPSLGYTPENVVSLCPNHHRLAHYGKVDFLPFEA